MAASARGLSITRWEPNLRWRSSVTRKTPPSTPTSSPRMITSASRSISCRSARFSALTMLSLVIGLCTAPGTRPSSSPRLALPAHGHGISGGGGGLPRPRSTAVAEPGDHLGPLHLERGRTLGVRVIEDQQGIRGRHRLEAADRLRDLGVDLGLDVLVQEPLA